MIKFIKNTWQGICQSFDLNEKPLILTKRFEKKKKLKWKKKRK